MSFCYTSCVLNFKNLTEILLLLTMFIQRADQLAKLMETRIILTKNVSRASCLKICHGECDSTFSFDPILPFSLVTLHWLLCLLLSRLKTEADRGIVDFTKFPYFHILKMMIFFVVQDFWRSLYGPRHDRMLEDTNSLDGAHIMGLFVSFQKHRL